MTPPTLQIVSTFGAGPIETPLRQALASAGVNANIGFTSAADMSAYMFNPPPDSENIAGTIVLVRAEDWLREGFLTGKSADAWAREELKARLRDFASELGILIYRGTPVWFMACPSSGWISEEHKIAPLCRTYTNLLAARVSNSSQAVTLNWPQGLTGDDRNADRANHVPFTQDCFDQLGAFIGSEVSRTLATKSGSAEPPSAASPELAAYLAGLQVRIELGLARESDRHHVDRIIRTAASFSLTGEQPNISDAEINAAIASQNCLLVSVTDRLAEHGPSGVVFSKKENNLLIVEWMSLTCPVLGKQVEHALIAAMAKLVGENDCSKLIFQYRSSARNQPILRFLESVADRESESRFALAVVEAEARINAAAVNPAAWTLTMSNLQQTAETRS